MIDRRERDGLVPWVSVAINAVSDGSAAKGFDRVKSCGLMRGLMSVGDRCNTGYLVMHIVVVTLTVTTLSYTTAF